MKFLLGAAVGVVACVAFFQTKEGQSEEHGNAIIAAYNKGRADAIKINPPSWDLEQSCLALWAGHQAQ